MASNANQIESPYNRELQKTLLETYYTQLEREEVISKRRSNMSSYDNGHASKRQRTDTDGHGVQAGSVDNFDDPHKLIPSLVVHIRNLSEMVQEEDVWDVCERYGKVADMILLSRKKQALVEFQDFDGSKSCVDSGRIYIGGTPAYVNYSTSQRIDRQNNAGPRAGPTAGGPYQGGRGGMRPEKNQPPNHILLFTIMEPIHPITVDVMKTICTAYGKIARIVIFRKSGVQSMVEFEDIDSATNAKDALQGADIYTNCCTLRIEYAKADRLNVRKNDPSEGWDFTIPEEPERQPLRNRPLLPDPRYAEAQRYDSGMGGGTYGREPRDAYREQGMDYRSPDRGMDRPTGYGGARSMDYQDSYRADAYQGRGGFDDRYVDRGARGDTGRGMMDRGRGPGLMRDPGYGMMDRGMGMGDRPGCVMMVYGMNMEKMNCDRLFNLLCLYGNVIRIKFLMKKEGAAMVEMDDLAAVERAMNNMNRLTFFGNEMTAGKSKQPSVQEVSNPHTLTDGTSSYKDYSRSRNNRYTNMKHADKNRVQKPGKVLHYFNAPPEMDESDLKELFEGLGVLAPTVVKKLPPKSERSSLGLMMWDNLSDATEALVVANHYEVKNPNGRMPYIYKLCFSSSETLD